MKLKNNGQIININYVDEMKNDYINYAMSVLTDRAVPDIRDGLKPVHRRILYSMFEKGITPDKAYAKCAEIVGNVTVYHPHGSDAIYDSLVRLAQDFSLYYPLIDFHGNKGSINGDPPAAFRYTEAKLSKLSLECLSFLKYNTVDMQQNYTETHKEPCYLPVLFPNLLINGSMGIAVGMTTSIPTHNIKNVINSVIYLIDNPNASTKDILSILKGPDFPTGGIIANKKDLLHIYESGQGSLTLRGKYEIEKDKNKNKIIITEIPYTISGRVEAFVDSIIKMAKSKKELQITNISDETSNNIRIIIEFKNSIDPNVIISYLCKYTAFESKFKVSFLCLVDDCPKTIGIKEYLQNFINFQIDLYTKKYKFLYNQNLKELEKYNGLVSAYDHIETIIYLIKNSKNMNDVKDALINGKTNTKITIKQQKEIKTFHFTQYQTDIILSMELAQLSKLKNIEFTNKKISEINDNLNNISILLNNKEKLILEIKDYLLSIKKNYGSPRKTEIININDNFKKIINHYNIKINDNYIIKTQNNNGLFIDDDKIYILTDVENIYSVKVKNIQDDLVKGIAAENYVENNEKIKCIFSKTNKQILIVTNDLYCKIVPFDKFNTNRTKLKGTNRKVLFAQTINNETKLKISDGSFETTVNLSDVTLTDRLSKGTKIKNKKLNTDSNLNFIII